MSVDKSVDKSWLKLKRALDTVISCPTCRGHLSFSTEGMNIECEGCGSRFPIVDGIPIFLSGSPTAQESEIIFRDNLATKNQGIGRDGILNLVSRHHCIPVMYRRAIDFTKRMKKGDWILDIGIGYGWHWNNSDLNGANVLGIDSSLESLRVAKELLSDNEGNVVLVCADASLMPVAEAVISGVWSVQVFQHFPSLTLDAVKKELKRVTKPTSTYEIYNLHPAWIERFLYRIAGRKYHTSGTVGLMELNRLTVKEWLNFWSDLSDGQQVTFGYSELFFHPNFRLRPRPYPLETEYLLTTAFPGLASLIARQSHVKIERIVRPN